MVTQTYTREFYDQLQNGSRDSASQILPIVLEMTGCRSVIDIGCGRGTWLSVWERLGVSDILGVDGDYVGTDGLEIAPEKFVPFDISKGFKTDKQFDLAMSLEVAEHLQEKDAETYLDSLVGLAPVLFFSAAIPFQEGQAHVNEQWPEYWVSRFAERGFVAVDCIRPRIWADSKVEWWYAQNAMIFVKKDHLQFYPALQKASETSFGSPMAIVHPRLFLYKESNLSQLRHENECLKQKVDYLRSPTKIFSSLSKRAFRKLTGFVSGQRNGV